LSERTALILGSLDFTRAFPVEVSAFRAQLEDAWGQPVKTSSDEYKANVSIFGHFGRWRGFAIGEDENTGNPRYDEFYVLDELALGEVIMDGIDPEDFDPEDPMEVPETSQGYRRRRLEVLKGTGEIVRSLLLAGRDVKVVGPYEETPTVTGFDIESRPISGTNRMRDVYLLVIDGNE